MDALPRVSCGLGLLLAGSFVASAQLPQLVLNHVFPAGAAAGATNEVTVNAADFEEPGPLVFSHPRILGTLKPGAPGVYRVVVPADVPSGLVEVRVTGRFGVSNPRGFLVEGAPAPVQPSTNSSPASAATLLRGAAVWGRIPAATRAVFALSSSKGERVLVRVQTAEIDSRLVPDLALFDPAGREVARTRRSGLIDFTATTAGVHRLELADAQFRGGDDFFYRIERLNGPHVDFALPVGLGAGGKSQVTLFGRQLPGAKPSGIAGFDGTPLESVVLDVQAPAFSDAISDEAAGWLPKASSFTAPLWTWTWRTTNGPANPVLFALGTSSSMLSALGTQGVPAINFVQPPVDFSGLFPRVGEVSGVQFDAKKGDVFWMEIVGDRLGQIVDPMVLVQRERTTRDAAGRVQYADVVELGELDANPGGNELPMGSRDAAGRFEAPEDGRYRVLVRDLFNPSPAAPRRAFRLTVRRASPDFRLVAWAQPPPRANGEDRKVHITTPVLRRGGTLPVKVAIARMDGFDGPLEVVADGLPPGVTAAPGRIAGGATTGTVLLTAAETVAGGSFGIRLVGHATVGTNHLERTARSGVARWPVADFNQDPSSYRLSQVFRVGVAPEPEPVVVAAAEERVFEVKAGAKLSVPLRVARRYEFPAAFNMKAAGHPVLEKAKEFSIAEKATNAVFELNLAETALPEGEHVVWVQGQVAGKYRNQAEAIALADTELKSAEAALKSASAEAKAAIEERKKQAEAARKAAEERAKPRDVTLGVWSAPIRVKVVPAK